MKIVNKKRHIRELIYLLAVIIYLLLGFYLNLWHPGWIVFLLATLIENTINSTFKIKYEYYIYVGAVIIYLPLGFYLDLWHPGWIIFLVATVINLILKILI
ncbi:MAG: hypothetical protein FWF57_02565 [Defluviitaleaceae bacterium]|nr:hypothetical protein [Defluviitaleaceae bacterium]